MDTPRTPIDTTVWRLTGAPLLAGTGVGPLAGMTVAVKDLFELQGAAVGAGVPDYLAGQSPAAVTAPAVTALLDAGADVVGIAQTDQFAYSIAGRNAAYGTPPNAAVPGALPGGSSSGPAAAVALGEATVGLGTDTGGSIRVPASYQGLWGLRTTHGAVPVDGVLPLAPSYDTVGWLTRDADTLATVARVGLANAPQHAGDIRFALVDTQSAGLPHELDKQFRHTVDAMIAAGFDVDEAVDPGDLADLSELYRVTQAHEAWRSHGEWVSAHPGALGADIQARFDAAALITAAEAATAREAIAAFRISFDEQAEGRVLLLPAAASAAPPADAPPADLEAVRAATMRLTCIGGLTGRPALSAPLMQLAGGPVGLSLIGARNTDVALVELAASVADSLNGKAAA
ncbi:amidase family protein [Gryllotalpicola protaetiae]|uniref:Amidase n=1 Tax=Gryllotalpicola protaetiae TaxID=2419771 RepID=A0A387BJC5_9MICO|nr:amidase family protein [Gryllotalpicola protaetiae]AYG02818.1 amidase [Gryllotalpicola protaetiae]